MEQLEKTVELDRLLPALAIWEESIRTAQPKLEREEILDRALSAALASLRYDLSRETVDYLRWRVKRSREEANATMNASLDARRRRLAAVASLADCGFPVPADVASAIFRDSNGRLWRVREIVPPKGPWTRGRSCLLFESDEAIRRVWDYPPGWSRLPDAELETLSWRR